MIQTWLQDWQPQCSCRSRYQRNGVTNTWSSPPQRGQAWDARRSWRELSIATGMRGTSGTDARPVDVPDFGTPKARRYETFSDSTPAVAATPPVREQVVKRLFERNFRLPTGRLPKPAGVADENRDVVGSHPFGIGFDADRDAGAGDERVEHRAHGASDAGGDVVHRARRSAADQGDIGTDGIPHVEQVALRFEVAHANHRIHLPTFDCRNLPCDARRHERRRLPRTGMVEGSGDDDLQTVFRSGLQRELLLRQFAQRVRAGRPQRFVLVDWR